MMMNGSLKALAIGLILTVPLSCNRTPIDIHPADYFGAGAVVQLEDQGSVHVTARLSRDEVSLDSGSVRFAGYGLTYYDSYLLDSAYQAVFTPAGFLAGGSGYFAFSDGTRYADSMMFNVVDTFSISDNVDPQNRLLPGGGPVTIEWTSALNAEGYIIATVKAGEAYFGTGYSALAATGQNGGTIPASAFVDPVTSELDTGLYYIYVYAYNGAPDSAQASHWLPTSFPMQTALNISHSRFTGRFGTVSVTAHDSMQVTSGK